MATATPSATATACTISFTDVPAGSTFYSYVECLACKGVINGYPDGTFRPNDPVTRGQIAKIVSNAAGFNDPAGGQIYQDVAPGSTFYDYVQRLSMHGIVQGYACGTRMIEPCMAPGNLPYFRPQATATRGQVAKMVSQAAGYTEQVSTQTFQDVEPVSTFYTWIERLATRSIINGYACGAHNEPCVGPQNRPYFRPTATITRGQIAKIASITFFPDCVALTTP